MRQISLAFVLMSIAGAASAGTPTFLCDIFPKLEGCQKQKHEKLQAPEIDPSSAIAAMSLLAGGLAVLHGRRIKATRD